MIVTPLVGSLILFWMVDGDGIIGATLQRIYDDNALSLKASPTLTWIMLIVYGIWHIVPFSFIVFYAGLQTVPRDTLESAMIDGRCCFGARCRGPEWIGSAQSLCPAVGSCGALRKRQLAKP